MGLLRKGDKTVSGPGELLIPAGDAMASTYPVLTAFLTQSEWEKGEKRERGSMLIFEQDSMLKMMLRDPNDGTCLWVAARGFSALFDAAEGSLCDPGAEWRTDRRNPGDKAKRVQKGS